MSEQGTGDQAVDEYDGDLQWIKMKISVGVLRHFITRDDDGNRLILSLKGPDKHGFFEGTIISSPSTVCVHIRVPE